MQGADQEFLFSDEDECASGTDSCICFAGLGVLGCVESCVNTVGSYTCGCNAGFALDADGVTCIGR